MAYVFDRLLSLGIRKGQIPARTQEAREWFRQQAKSTSVSESHVMRPPSEQKDRFRQRQAVGKMYFFFYDPKHKKTLPYYDTFPLVFPIGPAPNGFLGINMHYLPLKLRAKLMDQLYTITNNSKYDESTKLKISYDILNSASRFKEFKPCIKHYLKGHVKSRFLMVESAEWDIALFLPVAKFQKASQTQVWKDSRQIIRKG